MKRALFTGGDTIQVGGLNTTSAETVAANTQTTAFASDKVVEIKDVDGTGGWFLVVDDGATVTPAADTGYFLSSFERTRPFTLTAGKVIESSAKIQLNTLDVEE